MRIFAFALLLCVTLANPIQAQTFGGAGTRAQGMGGAFVAVADDASAIYWNPAGIATGATFDFQVSAGDNSNVFVGAALPVLGAAFYKTRQAAGVTTVPDDPGRQDDGSGDVPVRTLTTSNFGVTVVQTVTQGLVIGTTARGVWADVDDLDVGSTFDLDVGAMMTASYLRFGVTARNLRE